MSWSVRFWGVRGSIPAPGPDTVRYGGNTSCVEARVAGQLFIFDSGTGIRPLGLSLMSEHGEKPIEGHILIGHTHWDHIQGFPFFLPAYAPRNRFRIYSSHGVGKGFEKIFREQMNQNYFPIETGDMASKLEFLHVNGPFSVGDVRVETTFSNHPGVNLVYRLRHGDRSMVYLTDHENYQAQVQDRDEFSVKQDRIIEEFCRGADLL
ncbi:MAG TPA: MBL fold metallo-hydrolase, partial [Elusimicrobiota bacterium]|nr:MBL fold metallo-hydrolase [Elusimicrobiota bacterium]